MPSADSTPWVEDKCLVARFPVALPARCIRCNGPTARRELAALRWQPRGRMRGVIGAVEVLARTQTIPVRFHRCAGCRPAIPPRVISTSLGILGGLAAIISPFAAAAYNNSLPAFGVVMGFAAVCWVIAILTAVWPHELRVVHVEGDYCWLAGCSAEFLRGFQPDAEADADGAATDDDAAPAPGRPRRPNELLDLRRSLHRKRVPLLLLVVIFFLAGAVFCTDWVPIALTGEAPIVEGRVAARQEATSWWGRACTDLTIRLANGTLVHGLIGRQRGAPDLVHFRYGGNPRRLVFLFEIEENPFWIVLYIWSVAAAFACVVAWAWRKPPARTSRVVSLR